MYTIVSLPYHATMNKVISAKTNKELEFKLQQLVNETKMKLKENSNGMSTK